MQQALILKGLQIYVTLGCSEEERAYKQKIEIDIQLNCSDNFYATSNDNINSTICYLNLRNKIQNFCDSLSCNLIEYLTTQIYRFINQSYKEVDISYIKLTKKPTASQIRECSFILKK